MQIVTCDFDKLATEARKELRVLYESDGLLPDTALKVEAILDGYIQLYHEKGNWISNSGFNLTVSDFSDNLINDFKLVAKRLNMSLGSLLSILMQTVVETEQWEEFGADILRPFFIPKAGISINHHKKLSVGRRDLEDLGTSVSFNHISYLYLEDDIPEDVFTSNISSINHCKTVSIPDSYSKLIVLSRLRFCNKIEIRKQ